MTHESPMPRQFEKEYLLDKLVGTQLRRLRERCGLTLEEMQTLTGLPTAMLEDHESGELPLPLPRLEAIAAALDRSTVELFMDLLYPRC